MTAAVPSGSTYTYGSLTIGGTSDFQPHGPHTMSADYNVLTVRIPFVVTSGLSSAIDSIEEGLRVREADLSITFSGKTRSWTKSAGTGFNHRGFLEKPGNELDTGSTRYYVARVEVELPADDNAGRKDARWRLTQGPGGRYTLVFTGKYTGIPGTTSARAAYLANIDTWTTSILTLLGGSWDRAERDYSPNEEDSLVEFTDRWEGIIFPQGLSLTDVPSLVDARLVINRTEQADESTPASVVLQSPVRVTASYDAHVDSSSGAADLQARYASTVRPLLISKLREHLSVDEVALIADDPSFDYRDSAIRGTMVIEGYDAGDRGITSYRLTVGHGGSPSETIIPVADTKPHSAEVTHGPAVQTMAISESIEVLGVTTEDLLFGFDYAALTDGLELGSHGKRRAFADLVKLTGKRWVPTSLPQPRYVPITRGLEPHQVNLVQIQAEHSFQRVDAPAVTSGGG